jgi:hypothetical protein
MGDPGDHDGSIEVITMGRHTQASARRWPRGVIGPTVLREF